MFRFGPFGFSPSPATHKKKRNKRSENWKTEVAVYQKQAKGGRKSGIISRVVRWGSFPALEPF